MIPQDPTSRPISGDFSDELNQTLARQSAIRKGKKVEDFSVELEKARRNIRARRNRALSKSQQQPTLPKHIEEGKIAFEQGLQELDSLKAQRFEEEKKREYEAIARGAQYYAETQQPVLVGGGVVPAEIAGPVSRGVRAGAASLTRFTGQALQSAFDSDEGPTVLGDVGKYLSEISGDIAQPLVDYEKVRPKELKSWHERTLEFTGQAPFEMAKFAGPMRVLKAAGLGDLAASALGFGMTRGVEARAQGIEDPKTLAKEFAQGVAEGMLLSGLGKTSNYVQKWGASERVGRGIQAGAQFGGGVAQTKVDSLLHAKDGNVPDYLDYLHGGLFNVILDPVVLGGSGKAKKTTSLVANVEEKLSNETIPDNLKQIRPDFWQPMDAPWENKVTSDLLNSARVQLVQNPGEPDGTMYVNPQAAFLLDRMMENVDPGAKLATGMNYGVTLDSQRSQVLGEAFINKAEMIKRAIQADTGEADLHKLANGALMYEALGEQLMAASQNGRPLAFRFMKRDPATVIDPANPKLDESLNFEKKVVGHEGFHQQQFKIAEKFADTIYSLTSPGWLADHPIGAKIVSRMGMNPKHPLNNRAYDDPSLWTAEAVAYAAQPGESGLGLTKKERGVLIGDYLANVMDKHGSKAGELFYAGNMDREVARVAFRRLYEANRVKVRTDLQGNQIGLEWSDVIEPTRPMKDPANPYSPTLQLPLPQIIGPPEKVNKAIKLNDLWHRMRGSVVRNGKGELIPVYHGSPKGVEIKSLDLDKLNPNDWLKGLFLTQDYRVAGGYAKQAGDGSKGKGSNIHQFYLEAKKPIDLDSEVDQGFKKEFYERLGLEVPERVKWWEPEEEDGPNPFNAAEFAPEQNDEVIAQAVKKLTANGVKNELRRLEWDLTLLDRDIERDIESIKTWEGVVQSYKDNGAGKNASEESLALLPESYKERIAQTQAKVDALNEQLARRQAAAEEKEAQVKQLKDSMGPMLTNPEAIEKVRKTLLEMGYDAATHIGGGEREAKTFATREEAEAYADETGGRVEIEDKEYAFGDMAPINALLPKLRAENPQAFELLEQINRRNYSDATEVYSAIDDIKADIAGFKRYYGEEAFNKMLNLQADMDMAMMDLQSKEKVYTVQGHRVWIAFHPDQIVSATAYDPKIESYMNKSERDRIKSNSDLAADVKRTESALPYSIEPDPMDEVDPVSNARLVDEFIDSLDPNKEAQLNKETATPAMRERITELRRESYEAMNNFRNLNGKLKRAKEMLRSANLTAEEAGVDNSDYRARMEPLIAQLKQEVNVARASANDASARLNELLAEVIVAVDVDRQDYRQKFVDEAEKRLEDLTNKLDPNEPFYDSLRALGQQAKINRIGLDIILAAKIEPRSDISIQQQIVSAIESGKLDVEKHFTEVLDAEGMTLEKFLTSYLDAGTAAARALQQRSVVRRILNKTFKDSPEVLKWFESQVPTVREIRKIAKGRSNVRRFIDISSGMMLTGIRTAQNNYFSGLFKAGFTSGVNLFTNLADRVRRGEFEYETPAGELETAPRQSPPIIEAFRPMYELARVVGPYKKSDGNLGYDNRALFGKHIDPNTETGNVTIRRLSAAMKHFPEIESKMLLPLEADVESMDISAMQKTLTLMKRQVANMANGPKRRRLEEELARAEKRYQNEATTTSKILRKAEAGVHMLLKFQRAQEETVRIGSFVGQLHYRLRERGMDLGKMETEGRMDEIPAEVVHDAVMDALKITYGVKPDPYSTNTGEAWWGKTIQVLRDKNLSGTLINFPNFYAQYIQQFLQRSPLGLLKMINWSGGDTLRGENYRTLGTVVLGSAMFAKAYLMAKEYYDELEEKKDPTKVTDAARGAEWYHARIPGTSQYVDVRSSDMGPHLFLMDEYERWRRGMPSKVTKWSDIDQGLGSGLRGLSDVSNWAKVLVDTFQNDSIDYKQKGKHLASEALGGFFSRFATPFSTIRDLAGEIDIEQRKIKETRGMFGDSIIDPSLDKMPWLRETLPDRIDPFTGRPMLRNHPGYTQGMGMTIIPEQSYPQKVFGAAGVKLGDWIPFTGIVEVDQKLVAEIGKQVGPMSEALGRSALTQQDISFQTAYIYEMFREVALDSLQEVLSDYPEIEDQMKKRGELNKWEKWNEGKTMKAAGAPTAQEIYDRLKIAGEQMRAAKKAAVDNIKNKEKETQK